MKKLVLTVMVLAVVFVLASCGSKTDEGARTTFTVGFDAEFPPYGFVDATNGGYKGFDLDLARAVAEANGWTIELKAIDWAAKDAELNAGTIDCIWNGFTITPERKDMYTWSAPYVQNKQFILVRDNTALYTFKDLNGKIVVAQDGSSGAEALDAKIEETQKENPAFALKDVKKVKDYLTAKAMLESGAADAVALDSAVAYGFIEKAPGQFRVMEEPLMFEEYGIGFKKGNTELRDTVQTTLKKLIADGTVEKILTNWRENEADNGGNGIDFILTAE